MTNEPDARIRMDIELRLQEDRTGSFKSSVSACIAEQTAAIEAILKKGAPPDEYTRLTAIKKGLDAASLVLERTWSYYHA